VRRSALLLSVALAASVTTVNSFASADGPIHVGTIGADEAIFWEGGDVGYSPVHSAPAVPSSPLVDRCSIEGHPCFRFVLTLSDTGERLRIGLDTPARDDGFEVTITGPGTESARFVNSNRYSNEAFIGVPTPGDYQITVAPYSSEYAHFRMRAKLESVVVDPTPNAEGELLPNIAVTRLWEFGFAAPANPLNGLFPPDDINPPLTVAGFSPVSCAVDETVEDGAERCLRYSFGMANIGDGSFRVRYNAPRTGEKATAVQCIEMADGSTRSKPAGTTSFHTTHGHDHYDDFIYHELFKVTDTQTGAMESVGNGKKLGYSPADQAMPEWEKFNQASAGSSSSAAGNCSPEHSSSLGMSRGWGDSYRYQRPGNYVEFGTNGDGYYLAITVGDPLDLVKETNEDDNTAYAYLQIIGDQIRVIESGSGTSPWDPNKVLFTQ
jgi:hypothetical protein